MPVGQEHVGLAVLLLGTVLVFAVMYANWSRTSRALRNVLTLPTSEPPKGLSPTALGWVYARAHNRSFQDKGFVAALVSLGLRGKLVIDGSGERVTFYRRNTEGAPTDGDLPAIERVIMTAILGNRSDASTEFFRSTGFRKATRAVRKLITKWIPKRYFARSWIHVTQGFAGALITLMVFDSLFPAGNEMRILVLFSVLNGLLLGWCSGQLFASLTGRLPAHETEHRRSYLAGLYVATMLVFVMHSGLVSSPDLDIWIFRVSMTSSLAMSVIVGAFASIMIRPTPEGEKLLGEIEGFRAYLSGSDGNDTKLVDVSEVTVDLFERYLPHAIALGVEQAWAERFERNLKAKSISEHVSYAPGFYSGPWFTQGAIAESIVDIISKTEAGYRRARLFG